MSRDRFEFLLRAAHKDKDVKEGERKVYKRLGLVEDVLV